MNIKKLLTPENTEEKGRYLVNFGGSKASKNPIFYSENRPLSMKHLKTLAIGTKVVLKKVCNDPLKIIEHGDRFLTVEVQDSEKVQLKLYYTGNSFFLISKNQ